MENVRRRMKLELVSSDNRVQKLINKPTFKYTTTYSENLSAVSLDMKVVKFDKPMYVGFVVLEVSKTLMYDYHYNTMKKHYNDSITLMYTDTGILFIFCYYKYLYN
jgi:3'-phosphoadenosine 5'-phosphosulfate sulfotransferase (PAPS reductase)/FAD synthetase